VADRLSRVPALRDHVSRDRSLEEFLGGESEEGEAPDRENEPVESDRPEEDAPDQEKPPEVGDSGGDGTDPGSAVTTLDATYRWSPDGTGCESCGKRVEAQWRGEDGFVCAGCKEW